MLIKTLKRVIRLIPDKLRLSFLTSLMLLFINSVLELAGLAMIIAVFSLILDQDAVLNNPVISKLYFEIGFEKYSHFLSLSIGLILLAVLIKNIVSTLIIRYQLRLIYAVFKDLTRESYFNYYHLSFIEFKNEDSNKVLRNISHVPRMFAMMLMTPLLSLLSEVGILIFIVLSMLTLYPLVVLVVSPVITMIYGGFYAAFKKRIQVYDEELNDLVPKSTESVFNMIFGYVDFHIRGSIDKYFNRYKGITEKESDLRIKQTLYVLSLPRIIEISMILSLCLVLGYGFLNYTESSEIITLLGIFGLAAYRCIPSINRILSALIQIKGKQYTLDILEMVQSLPKDEQGSLGPSLKFKKKICFQNVSLRFQNEQQSVLNKISFEINKGSVFGCIGKSGSGKTTIINLLLGFLVPSEGSIKIDDVALSPENANGWRKKVGYVKQDTFLLNGTIEENIALGDEVVDYKKVKEVLEISSLSEFFSGRENNEVKEFGKNLSGGQKQRIGIARALYHDADIIVFDEATSALDDETEHEITNSIYNLKKEGFTIFIVAHRKSTLVHCDVIFDLDKGVLRQNDPIRV